MDDTRLEYSIGGKVYNIISVMNSRFSQYPKSSSTSFFKYLKNEVDDKYRQRIKETGPYNTSIEYKLDHAYNQLRLYVNGIMVIQLLARHMTLECVVAILIYMNIDSIEVHHGPLDGVEPWIDLWMQCEDCDILEYLLGSKFIDDPEKTCAEMIEHNVQLGRNEIVMELLRWKHDHLGHNDTPVRL